MSILLCPFPEFSVLVDVVSVERGSLYSAACGENILSLYQFNISSTNSQPTDKGEDIPHLDNIHHQHEGIHYTCLLQDASSC